MTTLADIRTDPNYTNANPATKAAIFDKFANKDSNYTKANPATQAAIRSKFGVPDAEPAAAKPQGRSWGDIPGEAASNLGSSAIGFVKGMAQPFLHPLETLQTIDAFNPFSQGNFTQANQDRRTQTVNALVQAYKARYGGADAIKNTLATDPVGVLADASAVLSGGETALSRVAPRAAQVARTVNPAVNAGKVAKVAASAVADPSGTVNALAGATKNALRRDSAALPAARGGGAMDTSAATARRVVAEGLPRPLQLTRGQITRDPAQLRFENDTQKTHAGGAGRPLVDRQIQQNEDILANFDSFLGSTGAERAGEGQLRPVGEVVDKALVSYAKKAKSDVDAAYTAARAAGEMQEPVSYIKLSHYIDSQSPTVRRTLAPIVQAVREQLRAADPSATGSVPINTLEEIRQAINKNTQPGTPNAVHGRALKELIDESTAEVGGDLYKEARERRLGYAKEFENVGAVDKLLRQKPGTTDRAVAMEDVFDHSILRGSLDDTQAIANTLDRAGEAGQQAWKELQGQTIEHIKDQVTKSVARDPNGNPFPSPARFQAIVKSLDTDGKLDFVLGKELAQKVRDLNDVVQAAYTAPPGTINTSNNSGYIVEALEKLQSSIVGQIPGVKAAAGYAAEKARTKELTRKVQDALYPDAPEADAASPNPPKKRPAMPRNAIAASNQNQNAMRGKETNGR